MREPAVLHLMGLVKKSTTWHLLRRVEGEDEVGNYAVKAEEFLFECIRCEHFLCILAERITPYLATYNLV